MSTFPNLHDATVESLTIDWGKKEARVHIRRGWPSEDETLVFHGLARFSTTRVDEWGPSNCILRMTEHPREHGCGFVIEIQSGDILDIEAADAALMPGNHRFVAAAAPRPPASFVLRERSFFSYLDEKHFFTWLESIDGVTHVVGGPGGLRVHLRDEFLSQASAFDIIALFRRYGHPLAPLKPHIDPAHDDYFKKQDSPWYDELYGAHSP